MESLVENANNINIARYMTDAFPHPYTADNAKAFINFATTHPTSKLFAIDIDGKAVGGIGLHPQTDIMRMNAELGYWLGENYWGKGIITQAIKDMVEYGFSNLNITRIYARPFHTNMASQRVLEKTGFLLEARLEKTIYKNGEYLDELIYSKRKR
jgi:RimJ/RimL family protein N-acetyltransferase